MGAELVKLLGLSLRPVFGLPVSSRLLEHWDRTD
jgi:hypothetical protein